MIARIKSMIGRLIDFILYTLLNEKQKERLSNLIPQKQKDALRRLTGFGKRDEQVKFIANIRNHLYSKGFTERAYQELTDLLIKEDTDSFMSRLVHYELALWHANHLREEDAKKAIDHLSKAKAGEKNKDQLRRIAIIKAESYCLLKEYDRARQLLLERLKKDDHPDLYLGIANTISDLSERLQWINKVFRYYNLREISFQSNYNELKTKPISRRIQDGPKVSVILPAYNAEDGIQIAIESILQQTWQNLELIIVDDCSRDRTLAIVKDYAKKDQRIKLAQTPENSGPYVARNIGLSLAEGEFVTVNDADDWSHAEKLEKQVTHLMENDQVIANTSAHARLSEELTLYRRASQGRYIFPNMSSIMFRREPVLEKLGYWDSVRFAADGEFKRRLIRQFGKSSYVDLETGPLSLPRQSQSSLTGSPAFGYNGFFMGARKEYVESLEYYHAQAPTLYYPYPLKERYFPVPKPMLPKKSDGSYDLILAGDFRHLTKDQITEIKELVEGRKKIGLIQLYRYDLKAAAGLSEEIRRLIDGEKVNRIVYGEKVKTKKMLILNHHTLTEKQAYIPTVKAEEVYLLITEKADQRSILRAAEQVKEHVSGKQFWHGPVPKGEEVSTVTISNKPLGSLRTYV